MFCAYSFYNFQSIEAKQDYGTGYERGPLVSMA
jgi:hypothetical protein